MKVEKILKKFEKTHDCDTILYFNGDNSVNKKNIPHEVIVDFKEIIQEKGHVFRLSNISRNFKTDKSEAFYYYDYDIKIGSGDPFNLDRLYSLNDYKPLSEVLYSLSMCFGHSKYMSYSDTLKAKQGLISPEGVIISPCVFKEIKAKNGIVSLAYKGRYRSIIVKDEVIEKWLKGNRKNPLFYPNGQFNEKFYGKVDKREDWSNYSYNMK